MQPPAPGDGRVVLSPRQRSRFSRSHFPPRLWEQGVGKVHQALARKPHAQFVPQNSGRGMKIAELADLGFDVVRIGKRRDRADQFQVGQEEIAVCPPDHPRQGFRLRIQALPKHVLFKLGRRAVELLVIQPKETGIIRKHKKSRRHDKGSRDEGCYEAVNSAP